MPALLSQRRLDQIGRVRVPPDVRRDVGLSAPGWVTIGVADDILVLTPFRIGCVFCEQTDPAQLAEIHGMSVCRGCAQEARDEKRLGKQGIIQNS